jgi:DNA-binding transcriptional MerR regulator
MASHHPIRKTVAPPVPVIPDKLYFRIGDVARLCEVPAYVLRFWETEFANLKPNKGGTGQRLYRRKDVETALRIKHLLYDLGYTIPGARQVFKSEATAKDASKDPVILTLSDVQGVHGQRDAQSKDPEATVPATNLSTFPAAAPNLPALRALRDELRALHAQLSEPVSTAAPLRPQLVPDAKLTEPRQKPESKPGPIVLPGQQALFPSE